MMMLMMMVTSGVDHDSSDGDDGAVMVSTVSVKG